MSGSWPPPSADALVGRDLPQVVQAPPAPVIVPGPAPVPPVLQPPAPMAAPAAFEAATQVVGPDPDDLARAAALKRARQQVRSENRRNRSAVLLVILATGLLGLATVTTWVNGRILNTPRYVVTVQPAATSPAVTATTTKQLEVEVGVPLIDGAARLVGTPSGPGGTAFDPAAFGVAVDAAIATAVSSPAFVAEWDNGQRVAQTRVLQVIDGQPPTEQELVTWGVNVDLAPLQTVVNDQLVAAGYTFVAGNVPQPNEFQILSRGSVTQYTNTLGAVQNLWWVPVPLALLAAAGAYALSTRRFRLTLLFGVDLMLVMGLVMLLSVLLANVVSERGVRPIDGPLLKAMYDPLGDALARSALIGLIVGGIMTVTATILISVRATRERRVRSQAYREALLAQQQAADPTLAPAAPNQ